MTRAPGTMGGVDAPDDADSSEPQAAPTLAGRALRALRPPPVAQPAEPVEPALEPAETRDSGSPVVLTKTAAEPEPATETDTDEPLLRDEDVPRAGGVRLVVIAVILAVLALGYAAVGLAVHLAGRSNSSTVATARDAAVTAARIDIATLYTLDYRNPQAGLARWRAVSTGGFEQQIAQSGSTVATAITKAKLITAGRVVAAAVTDLDVDKGTATVIASMDVTKTPATGSSATSRNRFRANLLRVNGVWKIADLSQVEVQLS